MPTMFIFAVGATGLVLVVLAVVVVGIRQEPSAQELTRQVAGQMEQDQRLREACERVRRRVVRGVG